MDWLEQREETERGEGQIERGRDGSVEGGSVAELLGRRTSNLEVAGSCPALTT